MITLVAPTSKKRIEDIAKLAKGFIYVVSSMGVTGVRSKITTDINSIVTDIKKVSKVPVAVGFGISTSEQAKEISATRQFIYPKANENNSLLFRQHNFRNYEIAVADGREFLTTSIFYEFHNFSVFQWGSKRASREILK